MFTLLSALAIASIPITDEPKVDAVKDEAEKLFRNMEENLEKAKTLECVFEGFIPTDFGSFEGSLFLAEGNKVWFQLRKAKNDGLQLQVDNEAARLAIHMVSDGKHQIIQGNGSGQARPGRRETPKNQNADLIAGLSRSGLMLVYAPLPEQKSDTVKDRFRLSDFKLGAKEKIGERETQKLEYKLTVKGHDGNLAALVVWLDSKTLLPVKRTLTPVDQPQKVLTENYPKLTINEKVDPKKFELPK